MRLNRVLLLAATISMMIFAMVFTISCSGDDGKNGKDGKGCYVEKSGNDYDVYCGDENVGKLVQGPKGDQGEPGTAVAKGDKGDPGPKGDPGDGVPPGACVLLPQTAGAWPVSCGGVVVGTIGNSGGGIGGCVVTNPDPFNDHEIELSCGGEPIPMCNGTVFDKTLQVCTNGKDHTNDLFLFNTTTKQYSNSYYGLAGSTDGKPDINGSVKNLYSPINNPISANAIFKCGTTQYNPNEQFCGASNTLKPLCGGATYDAATAFDTSSVGKSLSGNAIILGTSCSGSTVISRCVDGTGAIKVNNPLTKTLTYDTNTVNKPIEFDATKQFCRIMATPVAPNRVEAVDLCGGKVGKAGAYNGVTTFCENGKVVRKCAGVSYDDMTEFCYNNTTIAPYCTGDENGGNFAATALTSYDPSTHFCMFKQNGYSYKTDLCNRTTGGMGKFNGSDWSWSYCVSNTYDTPTPNTTVVSILACSNEFEGPVIRANGSTPVITLNGSVITSTSILATPVYPASVYAFKGNVNSTAALTVDCGCINGAVNNLGTGNKCNCASGVVYNPIENRCGGTGTNAADPCNSLTTLPLYIAPTNKCVAAPANAPANSIGATTGIAIASTDKIATCAQKYDETNGCSLCTGNTPNYNSSTNTCVVACATGETWNTVSNTCVPTTPVPTGTVLAGGVYVKSCASAGQFVIGNDCIASITAALGTAAGTGIPLKLAQYCSQAGGFSLTAGYTGNCYASAANCATGESVASSACSVP